MSFRGRKAVGISSQSVEYRTWSREIATSPIGSSQ